MELGGVIMITFSKSKYPTKKTMNLAVEEKSRMDLRIFLCLCGLGILCLLLLVQLAIITPITQAKKAKESYKAIENKIEQLKGSTKEFEQIKEEYRQFDNSLLSESEQAQFDRMKMIEIVESCVGKKANIDSITIVENQVVIHLNRTTLSSVSEIVENFEKNAHTSYVTVTNASTTTEEKKDSFIVAEILIQMVKGGDNS